MAELIEDQVRFNRARTQFQDEPKRKVTEKLVEADFEKVFSEIINFSLDLLVQEACKQEMAEWRASSWWNKMMTPGKLRAKIDKHYQWEGREGGLKEVVLGDLKDAFLRDLREIVAAHGVSVQGWANLKALSPLLQIHLEREEANICARIHEYIFSTPGYQAGLDEELESEEDITRQHLTRLLERRLVRLFDGRLIAIAKTDTLKGSLQGLSSAPEIFCVK